MSKRVDPERFLRNPGKWYSPTPSWYGWQSHVIDGTPWFTYHDIPRMTKDPQVRFILDMLRSPFQQAKFKVHAEDHRVATFVLTTMRKFWRRAVPGILERYFKWGFAPAILHFSKGRKGGIRFHKAQMVEPRDATPMVWTEGVRQGEFAGFRLSAGGAMGMPMANNSPMVSTPHAYWFAGLQRYGKLYDEPRLAGAFTPWLTKNGRGGAEHSTRLWYMKLAMTGGTILHPEGTTNIGTDDNPNIVNNQDLARQMLENLANGSGLTLPNTPGPNGQGKAWEYIPPATNGDPRGLLEYTDKLDSAISKGLGWPPEITEASEVGSGWSGRMVPAKAMLDSCDEVVAQLVGSADDCFLRELVHQRFGPKAKYEIEAIPLSEPVLGQNQQGAGQQPQGAPPQPGGDQGGDDGGLSALFDKGGKDGEKDGAKPGGGIPYRGPRGGQWVKDPRTGRVKYGANLAVEVQRFADQVVRKLGNANLSLDAQGHQHRGKGPGGGQFASQGDKGDSPFADIATRAVQAAEKATTRDELRSVLASHRNEHRESAKAVTMQAKSLPRAWLKSQDLPATVKASVASALTEAVKDCLGDSMMHADPYAAAIRSNAPKSEILDMLKDPEMPHEIDYDGLDSDDVRSNVYDALADLYVANDGEPAGDYRKRLKSLGVADLPPISDGLDADDYYYGPAEDAISKATKAKADELVAGFKQYVSKPGP